MSIGHLESDFCSFGNRKEAPNDRRRAIQDALFILLAVIMSLVIFCVAWASLDRLGWVRFVASIPLPGRLKMILWGWY